MVSHCCTLIVVGFLASVLSGGAETSPQSSVRPVLTDTARLSELRQVLVDDPKLSGDAYIRLGLAVAESFEGRPRNGGPAGKEDDWSRLQRDEVKQVIQWTEDRIQALLRNEASKWVPARIRGAVEVENGILVAPTYTEDLQQRYRRPYWFGGYGVWNAAAAAVPEFPEFGATLIQQERGPAGLKADGKLTEGAQSILPVLESAAEHGVKVDLLLSPHYMPEWSRAAEGLTSIIPQGHIKYNIDHPAARQFIEKWLRTIVPMVKDSPALFSFCLSNEPEYATSGRDSHSRPLWPEFLAGSHGSIDELNALYGTRHGSFEEVPVPAFELPEEADIAVRRAYFDWACFNHRHMANWHRWMNGIIKSIAPNVATHVKAMRVLSLGHRAAFAQMPDPELFCEFTDLAGCDAWATLPSHEGPDEWWWRSQQLYYDLLHAFRGQPVFDSESHLIEIPYGPETVPVSQTRCALWQGALHHRAATVLWVWEPWVEGVADLQGTIYFRPANIHAAGRTMLDLNRLTDEVTAVSRVRPKVALLYSMPSVFWDEDYTRAVRSAYTALLFMGQPVTFVTERQLESGGFSLPNGEIDWIIVPRATHVTDGAYQGLEAFVRRGGRVIRIGSDCLAWDEYHRRRDFTEAIEKSAEMRTNLAEKEVMAALRPVLASGNLALVDLHDTGTGSHAWNVEYLVTPFRGGLLVPLVNYGTRKTVALNRKGTATDLLNGGAVELDAIELAPMEPRLLFIPASEHAEVFNEAEVGLPRATRSEGRL